MDPRPIALKEQEISVNGQNYRWKYTLGVIFLILALILFTLSYFLFGMLAIFLGLVCLAMGWLTKRDFNQAMEILDGFVLNPLSLNLVFIFVELDSGEAGITHDKAEIPLNSVVLIESDDPIFH